MATQKPVNEIEPKEKMVKIKIPHTSPEEGDYYISINHRNWQIQRGVEVEVPDYVAERIRLKEDEVEANFRKNNK
jgi:hypothetical protein